uniref:F-box/FBD/LRR-repeat protein At1g13570-like n=1 Tax=Erigeron canadensis TaxID=72917 RepID=UPI001CB972B9|nr:F-box/FBD/LRR-repeat protein At1g13570-like [Erigeron canadensis]
MELVHGGSSKASKFVAEDDFISSLPETLITSILDRLPIRDAVRTGILARNWRLKWTMLSQLVLDEQFFKDLLGAQGISSYDWRNVIQFLLHLKGSITKFTLRLPKHRVVNDKDINHWFLFLSGKGIKDVTLINKHKTPLKLPAHLFSCLELQCLEIDNCYFHPPLSFRGFPNLLDLNLYWVRVESNKYGELLTGCPLLEILVIHHNGLFGKVKPVEISKLENLKKLTMPLFKLDTSTLTSSSIIELVGSFSKLQEVNLGFQM